MQQALLNTHLTFNQTPQMPDQVINDNTLISIRIKEQREIVRKAYAEGENNNTPFKENFEYHKAFELLQFMTRWELHLKEAQSKICNRSKTNYISKWYH